jgi:hypothetical protein
VWGKRGGGGGGGGEKGGGGGKGVAEYEVSCVPHPTTPKLIDLTSQIDGIPALTTASTYGGELEQWQGNGEEISREEVIDICSFSTWAHSCSLSDAVKE